MSERNMVIVPDREEWRPIPGFNRYEVSTLGRVRSLFIRAERRTFPCILKAHTNKKGYWHVSIRSDDGRGKTDAIHRIVAVTFRGPKPSPIHQAAHHDGDKNNNSVSNIFWKTPRENAADTIRHGRSPIGEKNPKAVLTAELVQEIRRRYAEGESYPAIAESIGKPLDAVLSSGRGLSWRHLPGGENSGAAAKIKNGIRHIKLTIEEVKEMRRRRLAGESFGKLSAAYGVSKPTVSRICAGKTWSQPFINVLSDLLSAADAGKGGGG